MSQIRVSTFPSRDKTYQTGSENMTNWDNVEWIEELWEEIPEPNLKQRTMAFSLMLAELEEEA